MLALDAARYGYRALSERINAVPLPLDRASAVSCFQQSVDGGVPGPGPVGEPMAVREESDRTAGFDVQQDSAVLATLAGGLLVDADDRWRGHLRLG
ncbi:hypothetical protein GR925_22570 [Streptomyces sp. HUCO-GS316]|nr:hypothetical protein [Streptomyces sp. HUCO-GS316]MXM66149.1 hypothetical protein [Streptomyces sp. HUCO-GS316]